MPGRGDRTALLPGVAHSGADPPSWKYTPMPREAAPRTIASYGAQPLSGYAAGSLALKFGLDSLVEPGATLRQLTRTFTMSTPRLLISSRRASRCAWSPLTRTLSSWSIVGMELLAAAVA